MSSNSTWFLEFSPGETRAALVDRRERLVELHVERMGEEEIVGSIHLGRVTRVEKGIGAAFVEFGDDQPGFLGKAKDVTEGQAAIVQVIRPAVDGKGAVLTVNPVLPGRYLSLDANRPGVHWRHGKREGDRAELAALLEEIAPADCGILPGPLAAGVDEPVLRAEVDRLAGEWKEIAEAAAQAKPPTQLRRAPGLLDRILREAGGPVVMDDPRQFNAAMSMAKRHMPDLAGNLDLFKGDIPLFEETGVEEQLEDALRPRVELPGGASLVIEGTEALTSIDVNMGGSGGRMRPDDAIRRANETAAMEVARQIRLRNIGGLIVVDFISMKNKAHRKQLVELLRREMRADPVRHDILGMTPGGLVEITRQRVGEPLAQLFLRPRQPAPQGLPMAVACAALREALRRPWTAGTVLVANTEVIEALQGPLAAATAEVDRRLGIALELVVDPGREGYEFRQAKRGSA
jgi:Rne/Rng family ribonuclease